MRDKIEQYYDNLPGILAYALGAGKVLFGLLIVFGVGWWLVNRLTKLDDHEELYVKRNHAFIAERAGFMLALAFAQLPLIGSKSGDWRIDALWMAGGGLWSALLLLIARPALSKLMGYERSDDGSKNRNIFSVGLTRGTFYFAGGWILNASFSGSAPNLQTAVLATMAFSALGLLVLALTFWGIGKFAGMKKRICQGNLAAAILASSFIAALGFGLRTAIAGDFTSWSEGLFGFGVTYVTELIIFGAGALLIDWRLIRHTDLREVVEEKNNETSVMFATALVILGLLVSMVTI